MQDITLVYETVESRPIVPGYLMDDRHAMYYDGQLWLCTVVATNKPDEYAVTDYIALTRKPVDLLQLFTMLRKMSALTFITDYLFYTGPVELELFPPDPPDECRIATGRK